MTTPYDPRSVANLMLDVADDNKIEVTNIALQKLLYFANGLYLTEHSKPLVSGYFEAWTYGPVHPAVYDAFKVAGANPINFRAYGCDPLTGQQKELQRITDKFVSRFLTKIVLGYAESSASRLIEISHAKKAPWDFIEKKARHSVVLGMRIPNDVIIERFMFHKVSLRDSPVTGDPREDYPLQSITEHEEESGNNQ